MVKTQCGFWLYPSHFSGAKKKRGVGGRETRERPLILSVPVAQSAKTLWDIPHGEKEKTRGTFLFLLPCSQLWSTQWCHLISGCYPASQHPMRMFAATFPLEKLIFSSPKNKPTPFFNMFCTGIYFFPLSSSALGGGSGDDGAVPAIASELLNDLQQFI